MTYFLDFDRTLFDTDAFIEYLAKHSSLASFQDRIRAAVQGKRDATIRGNVGRFELWGEIGDLYKSGELVFAQGDLVKFLYPDVVPFLNAHPQSIIFTYGEPSLLEAKIIHTLPDFPRERIVYTADKEKGPLMQGLTKKYPAPYVLVDDLPAQLASVESERLPISLYEMRRDGEKGDGRWPVVHSLKELS